MLLQTLSDYAASEQQRDIPELARHHAKRAVIDWFAATLPGARLPPATLVMSSLEKEFSSSGASVYGTGRRAPMRTAALINAASSHIIEFDDIFRDGLYHPGSPTVAAALAAAQERNADGDSFIRAVIAGYEISTRIAVAVQPAHYKYWHTTATVGTIGAAVATATVLGLDAGRISHAIGNSVTFAAGLQKAYASDTMSKPLHAGRAAEGGMLAALTAEKGVTGPLDILDGLSGFGEAMSDGGDWTKAVDALGARYNIQSMTIKNHGCCGHSHAALDGVIMLVNKNNLHPQDVVSVNIGTYKVARDITNRHDVSSAMEARFSTPFTAASALIYRSVRLAAFEPDRLRDPTVRALMSKVTVSIDDECERLFPRRSARVTIETTDGRRLSHFQPTRKGDPDAPLSDAELNEKYMELASPAVGAEYAAALKDRLWRLEQMTAADIAGLAMDELLMGRAEIRAVRRQ